VTGSKSAHLPDRGVISITGEDAGKFLQGLVTNDMALLGLAPAIHAGLLAPQGKILFDFFIVKTPDGYLLDTARAQCVDLVKRLTMYKLRSKVVISDVGDEYRVLAVWGPAAGSPGKAAHAVSFSDPRLPGLGLRILAEKDFADDIAAATGALAASADDYHAHRIGLGVPEGGKDYAFGDTFPHEALFDQLSGVSFTKGCYVGQEVVSRMEHRRTSRKRVVPIVAGSALPGSGTEIKIGDVAIGTLGSAAGNRGLALLRIDRAAEAASKDMPLTVDGIAVTIALPPFATFALDPQPAGA
jgi:folate-binding protein YgfZ